MAVSGLAVQTMDAVAIPNARKNPCDGDAVRAEAFCWEEFGTYEQNGRGGAVLCNTAVADLGKSVRTAVTTVPAEYVRCSDGSAAVGRYR